MSKIPQTFSKNKNTLEYIPDDPLTVVIDYLELKELFNLQISYPRQIVTDCITRKARKLNDKITIRDFKWIVNHTYDLEKISKTNAILTFRITKKQLEECKSEKKIMRVYVGRRGSKVVEANIYNLSDVIGLCIERHGSISGLLKYNKTLRERKEKRYELKRRRKEQIISELEKSGLDYNEYEDLALYFVNGRAPLSVIIRRISENHYLEYYSRFLEHLYNLDDVTTETEQVIIAQSLSETPFNDYPPCWPWLHNISSVSWAARMQEIRDSGKTFNDEQELFNFMFRQD